MSMLLCPRPIEWGILHWWPSSVCSSVCLSRACQLSDPKSRMEGRSKLKIDRKEAHDTGDPWLHLEVERSRSPGRWTSWPKISRIFQTGRPTNFKLGIQNTDGVRWVASPTCAVTSMVKGHCFNVTSSVWRLFAHNSTKKCRRKKTKLAERLSVSHSSPVPRSKGQGQVKVTRPFNAVTENQPYLRNRKACKSPLASAGLSMCEAQGNGLKSKSFYSKMSKKV